MDSLISNQLQSFSATALINNQVRNVQLTNIVMILVNYPDIWNAVTNVSFINYYYGDDELVLLKKGDLLILGFLTIRPKPFIVLTIHFMIISEL